MIAGIPENIKPEMFTNVYRDRCLYFIHKINALQYVNELNANEYVPISHSILNHNLFGGNYRKIIRELILRGVIERKKIGIANFNYKKSNEISGYRLTEKYRYQYLKWIEIKDLKLKKKIKVYQQTQSARVSMFESSLLRLDFDYNTAIQYVNSTYPEFNKKGRNPKHYRRINYIEALRNDKLYTMTDCNTSNRVYTTFSIMPKDLRKFCKNNLTQLDISSSQLFHFIPELLDYKEKIINPETTITDKYGNEITGNDTDLFIELVTNGTFFNTIMNAIDFKGTKREFKDLFFAQYWYCEVKPYDTELSGYLETNFPVVSKAIKHFKQSLKFPYTDKKERYKNFPIRLQAVERENVIDNICYNLIKENPEMLILSNQDAIYCESKNTDIVYSAIQANYSNYKPFIKIEYVR